MPLTFNDSSWINQHWYSNATRLYIAQVIYFNNYRSLPVNRLMSASLLGALDLIDSDVDGFTRPSLQIFHCFFDHFQSHKDFYFSCLTSILQITVLRDADFIVSRPYTSCTNEDDWKAALGSSILTTLKKCFVVIHYLEVPDHTRLFSALTWNRYTARSLASTARIRFRNHDLVLTE